MVLGVQMIVHHSVFQLKDDAGSFVQFVSFVDEQIEIYTSSAVCR